MQDNWSDYLVIWMDRIGTKDVQKHLVGKLMRDVSSKDLEPLERELEWSRLVDKWAIELKKSLQTFPDEVKRSALQSVNRLTGPPTRVEQLRVDERIQDAVAVFTHFQRVSDAIILAVPTTTPKGFVNTRGIVQAIGWASSMFLASLAGGFPLRAAAVVGIAGITKSESLVGPALQEAYQLEQERPPGTINGQEISNWSRFRVSDGLVNFIHECKSKNDISDVNCGLMCENYLVQDVTASMCINYVADEVPARNDLVVAAYMTASKQIEALSSPESAARRSGWERVVQFLCDNAGASLMSHAARRTAGGSRSMR